MLTALRIVSVIEGLSYLFLLYCAIYLKRIMGDAHAIETPGAIHGGLFVAFCLFLLLCWQTKKIGFQKSVLLFIASLLPFGFLWIEGQLKKLR